jgi:hypothetical protein
MSAFTRAFLFCDGDDCDATLDYSPVPSARTVTEAREEAKRGGWVRRKGRDLCDDCATPTPGRTDHP